MTPTAPATELSGVQKAAVLLMQMDRERAAAILRELRESEVADIMAEVAHLQRVEAEAVTDVLTEFHHLAAARMHVASGGLNVAREMLVASLGEPKADQIIERLTAAIQRAPFEFIRKADPRQVLQFLQDEHPQTIALVLAHMYPDHAAMVLSGLDEDLQRDVAKRVATMDTTTPEAIEHVEAILERKLSSVLQSADLSSAGGIQALVDILNRSDRGTERLILESLEYEDVELADEVRQLMFVFEDIEQLDDRSVQLVLRQVDPKDLATALKGVRPAVREKILRNMSERAAANLAEEIDLLGPVRIKAVEEAQAGVVRVIRSLEEAGQIVLTRGGEEYVV
ncbi:MAG TPA: flagellar motor switch protein FliG [Egibacteraceae bacterium]|nr:flagellar motor switch protein FliG [Egibacteraceae bacterium]